MNAVHTENETPLRKRKRGHKSIAVIVTNFLAFVFLVNKERLTFIFKKMTVHFLLTKCDVLWLSSSWLSVVIVVLVMVL